MKNKKMVIFLSLIAVCGIILSVAWQRGLFESKTPEEEWAEQTILAYIKAKELNIRPHTNEYNIFLKGIMLGGYPELTKPPSAYVKNNMERDYILAYAGNNYQLPTEWRLNNSTEIPELEAEPPTDSDN